VTRKEYRAYKKMLRDIRRMTRMIEDIGLWAESEHAKLLRQLAVIELCRRERESKEGAK